MKIVVVGGTGLVGSKVVEKLKHKGHEAIAAAPNTGVNTITGKGLKEAMAGAQVVIDLENSPSFEDKAVLEFFETAGRQPSRGGDRSGRAAPCRAVHRRNRPERQWLFPRQGRPRETDQDLRDPLHHHPRDPIPGIPRRHRGLKCGWKHGQASVLPVPAHRGGRRCRDRCRCGARAPRNGIVEIHAGPERAAFNEFVARYLKAVGDQRAVVRDPEARYFGGQVEEHSLVPLGEARLGHVGLDEWLRRSRAAA